MIVRFLSLSEERVLLAITAGTEQPNPSSIGTKLLPERPILRRNVSITKAILAIYPVSSNIDKKKNRIRITGRKLSTLPTPVNIPSITRLFTTGVFLFLLKPSQFLHLMHHLKMNQMGQMSSRK